MFHVLFYVRPFAFPRWAIRVIRVIRTFRIFRIFQAFQAFRFIRGHLVHPDHAAGYYVYGMKKGAEAYSLVIPRHRGDSHLYTSTPSIVPRVGLEPTRPFRARRF